MQYFSKENEPFWKRNSKVIFVTLLSLVVIFGSGTALYLRVFDRNNNSDNNYSNVFQNNRTSLPFTLNANTTVTNRLGLKTKSSNSSGSNSIQLLAAERFEEISGKSFVDFAKVKGIKVDPVITSQLAALSSAGSKNLTSEPVENNSNNDTKTPAISPATNPTTSPDNTLDSSNSAISSLNNASANDGTMVSSPAKPDTLVVYNENIISNFHPSKNSYITGLDNIDYSKPITTKSWYSANYRKFIAEQNGKIISYTLQTPDSYTEYLGGKYAIEQTLDKVNDNNLLEEGTNQATINWELEFIKSVLSNAQIKNVGTAQLDGKTVNIYQENLSLESQIENNSESLPGISLGDNTNTSTPSASNPNFLNADNQSGNYIKYYVDPEEIVLYQTDIFTNGELTNSSKTVKALEYRGEEEIKFFGANELAGITLNQAKDVFDPIKSNYLKFYSSKLSNADQVSVYENPHNQLASLRFNKDFNPSLNDSDIEKFEQSPIVTISQSKEKHQLITKIFDKDIDLEHYKAQNQQIAEKTGYKLTIQNASSLPTNCDFGIIKEGDKIVSRICSFKYNNYYYLVTEEGFSEANSDIFDSKTKELMLETIAGTGIGSAVGGAQSTPPSSSISSSSPSIISSDNNSTSSSSAKN